MATSSCVTSASQESFTPGKISSTLLARRTMSVSTSLLFCHHFVTVIIFVFDLMTINLVFLLSSLDDSCSICFLPYDS